MIEKINYSEDDSDLFYNYIEGLRISEDILWEFVEDLPHGFETPYYCDTFKTKLSFSKPYTTSGHDGLLLSRQCIAFVVGNGYLITDPITFSL